MAKHTIDYNTPFLIEQEINRMSQQSPALHILLHGNIKRFFERAQMHIKVLHKRMREIQDKYIEQDGDGKLQIVDTETGKEWKFLPSVTNIKEARILSGDEVRQAYLAESETFLSQHIVIDL